MTHDGIVGSIRRLQGSSGRYAADEPDVRLRAGPGPVFVYEWLMTTQRSQFYALRAEFLVEE
jgi:hypothetical protein